MCPTQTGRAVRSSRCRSDPCHPSRSRPQAPMTARRGGPIHCDREERCLQLPVDTAPPAATAAPDSEDGSSSVRGRASVFCGRACAATSLGNHLRLEAVGLCHSLEEDVLSQRDQTDGPALLYFRHGRPAPERVGQLQGLRERWVSAKGAPPCGKLAMRDHRRHRDHIVALEIGEESSASPCERCRPASTACSRTAEGTRTEGTSAACEVPKSLPLLSFGSAAQRRRCPPREGVVAPPATRRQIYLTVSSLITRRSTRKTDLRAHGPGPPPPGPRRSER